MKTGGNDRLSFKGSLAGTQISLLLRDPTQLQAGSASMIRKLNVDDSGQTADGAAVLTSTSLTGLDMTTPNTIQQVVVDATSGQYTLTYTFPVFPTGLSAVAGTRGTLPPPLPYYQVTALPPPLA